VSFVQIPFITDSSLTSLGALDEAGVIEFACRAVDLALVHADGQDRVRAFMSP
jgi:hypothetical protein